MPPKKFDTKSLSVSSQVLKSTKVAMPPGPPPPQWDSTELQSEIGSKNKDKKKLVMRVWYRYIYVALDKTFEWAVHYNIKAENKNLVGPGWHTVNELATIYYHFTYTAGVFMTKTDTVNLHGMADVTSKLISGTSMGPPDMLPFFHSMHITGDRSGGSSGIQIAWP